MPRRPLHKVQADAAKLAEALLALSFALDGPVLDLEEDGPDGTHPRRQPEDDFDGESEAEEDDYELRETLTAEVLELAGFSWAEFATSLSGTGLRGGYNTWLKSEDFFPVALQSPDRWFRHLFRFVHVPVALIYTLCLTGQKCQSRHV